jgi:hypothetical protein
MHKMQETFARLEKRRMMFSNGNHFQHYLISVNFQNQINKPLVNFLYRW